MLKLFAHFFLAFLIAMVLVPAAAYLMGHFPPIWASLGILGLAAVGSIVIVVVLERR